MVTKRGERIGAQLPVVGDPDGAVLERVHGEHVRHRVVIDAAVQPGRVVFAARRRRLRVGDRTFRMARQIAVRHHAVYDVTAAAGRVAAFPGDEEPGRHAADGQYEDGVLRQALPKRRALPSPARLFLRRRALRLRGLPITRWRSAIFTAAHSPPLVIYSLR